MRPLFTIHAGEYLVASEIERLFRRINVWVPSRDTGVDLLVTDRRSQRALSLQVKFSKDFTAYREPAFRKQFRACGWWTIDLRKLAKSPADYWVFVLQGFSNRTDFVILPPHELARRLRSIHGRDNKVHTYLWVTEGRRCWEARGIRKTDQLLLAHGKYVNRHRDFTPWLNNWKPIQRLDRG